MATKAPAKAVKSKPAKKTAPKAAKPKGRPSSFTQAVADAICSRMADGEPLREICRDDNMPAWRTVYSWQATHPEFLARIGQAREMGEDAIFSDCLRIADNTLMGEEVEDGPNGLKIKRGDMLGHRKLQIETRLKLLAKWNPRKYGEKLDINHGGQPENPVSLLMAQLAGKTLKPVDE